MIIDRDDGKELIMRRTGPPVIINLVAHGIPHWHINEVGGISFEVDMSCFMALFFAVRADFSGRAEKKQKRKHGLVRFAFSGLSQACKGLQELSAISQKW